MLGKSMRVINIFHAAGEAADARLLAERERHCLEVEDLEARAARTLEEAAAQALAPRLKRYSMRIPCLAACACNT